jgi:hypothetical protein
LISKKDLTARNPNPYNLTKEQLADVEITKAQVAKHLESIDFSKHEQPTVTEKQAKRVYEFSRILADRKSRNEY